NAVEEEEDIETAEEVSDETGSDVEDNEEDTAVDDTAEIDTEVNTTSGFLPSTMGISFLADVSDRLRIEATWVTYHKEPVRGYTSHYADQDETALWFRKAHKSSTDLDAGQLSRQRYRQTISPSSGHGVLDLDVVSRPWQQGRGLITVPLVNSTSDPGPIN